MVQPRSQQELYDIFKTEVQLRAPELTDWEDGSINDAVAGASATAMHEVVRLLIDQFRKTFFNTANGPEVTGSTDELENLAVDHFGEDFARPAAQAAVGVVKFSRPDTSNGDVTIASGTVVKTPPNANGESQRYETSANVEMTGTEINASVEAVEAGTAGNVSAGEVTEIETALTDPTITVTNEEDFSGGAAEQDDATYRKTIKNLIQQIRGATKDAIEAKLLTVSGIVQATVIEFLQNVIEYDDDTGTTSGESFTIPRVKAYVADANGTANDALVELCQTAADEVRACGVRIDVYGATAVNLTWKAQLTLDPGGPNYATLVNDTSMLEQTMTEYVQNLNIGDDFNRSLADAAMLAIWGPAGTGDLVALSGFITTTPSGNISADENERIIPDTIEIV